MTADLDLSGLTLGNDSMEALLGVDTESWRKELGDIGTYFDEFGSRVPHQLVQQQRLIRRALG
jgi:phosphoenolpyruvate carboxykinase (GTP)